MNIIEALNFRHAVKGFDSNKKVSDQDFAILLEALRLSPSSFGLQPWKFVVVKNPETRAQLKEHAWGQTQVTDASHLIVLCRLTEMTPEYIESFIQFTAKERGMDPAALEEYKNMMLGFIKNKTPEQIDAWMGEQVYIALGVLLTACATMSIEACPMEGFDSKAFDEILKLNEKGLKSTVVCAIGYHSEGDYLAKAKKVRFPMNEVVVEM